MIAALAIVILGAVLIYREYVHAKERSELLNRIQAPEVVVAQQTSLPETPDPIPVDMGPWSLPPEDEDE